GPEAQTTAALQFLGAPWSQPWFLCLNYYAAHGILGPSGESVFPVPPGMYQTGDPTLDQQAIIDYLEAQLEERLLPTVNLQETYLFVFSDNGTPSDAGGVEGRAKGSVYEEGVRNRLWVAGPGITPGVDTTSMVSVTDLWATCMDLTGGCGSGVGGEDSWSLAATLGGAPRQGPLWAGRFNPNVPPHDVYVQAAIEARWKLHRNKSGGEKFFDLEADPGELVELPLQGPDYGRLKAFLDSAHL
ncbi:MAG TPA: sulfatase-like hydrolase/transferase, partial [Methylomirabilota bacterium]